MIRRPFGFTIVELLVVIVVIAILATITVVAYNGIQQRSAQAAAQSGANQAAKKVQTYLSTENGMYPESLDVAGVSAGSITEFQYSVDNESVEKTYCITSTVRNYSYYIGYNQLAGEWRHTPTEGSCPGQIPANHSVQQLAAGYDFYCAVSLNKDAYCWGVNGAHLGINSSSGSTITTPTAVVASGALSGKKIKTIGVGGDGTYANRHACALATDSTVYCWGSNLGGLLGNNATTEATTPVAVDTTGVLNGKTIKSLAVGGTMNCVLTNDNAVYCWGGRTATNNGELGNGAKAQSLVPTAVISNVHLAGKTIKSLTVGYYHGCVLTSDGLAYCWGDNSTGQLGNSLGSSATQPLPVTMSGALAGKTIKSLKAGATNTCAIASDDQPYCWGSNGSGAVGDGSTTNRNAPALVINTPDGKKVASIDVASPNIYKTATCAQYTDGSAYCWGDTNQTGNLYVSIPNELPRTGSMAGKTIRTVSTGGARTYAVASDGSLHLWNNRASAPTAVSVPW